MIWSWFQVGDGFGSWASSGGDVSSPGLYDVAGCPDRGDTTDYPQVAMDEQLHVVLAAPHPSPSSPATEIRFEIERERDVCTGCAHSDAERARLGSVADRVGRRRPFRQKGRVDSRGGW